MSADLEFLEELVNGLETSVLEWLQIKIGRILAARKTRNHNQANDNKKAIIVLI